MSETTTLPAHRSVDETPPAEAVRSPNLVEIAPGPSDAWTAGFEQYFVHDVSRTRPGFRAFRGIWPGQGGSGMSGVTFSTWDPSATHPLTIYSIPMPTRSSAPRVLRSS